MYEQIIYYLSWTVASNLCRESIPQPLDLSTHLSTRLLVNLYQKTTDTSRLLITTPSPALNCNLQPLQNNLKPNPVDLMKPTLVIWGLERPKILELLKTLEADLSLESVSANHLQNWICKNSEVQDDKRIQYEYNFLAEHFIIKCMPTITPDFLQSFFNKTFSSFLIEKVALLNSSYLFTVSSRTSVTNHD